MYGPAGATTGAGADATAVGVGEAAVAKGVAPVIGAPGNVAVGAAASVADEVGGIAFAGVVVITAPGFAAFARFIDEGEIPPMATACGVTWVEGSAGAVFGSADAVAVTGGAADRATSDASSDALSCFHQAQRGPD